MSEAYVYAAEVKPIREIKSGSPICEPSPTAAHGISVDRCSRPCRLPAPLDGEAVGGALEDKRLAKSFHGRSDGDLGGADSWSLSVR